MSDPEKQRPAADGPSDASDQYGFDPERDPTEGDREKAEASEYGMYGYVDEGGRELRNAPNETDEPDPEESPDVRD